MNFIINPIMLIKSIQCEYLAKLIKVRGFLFPYLHEIRETEKIQELKRSLRNRAEKLNHKKRRQPKTFWKSRKRKETFNKK